MTSILVSWQSRQSKRPLAIVFVFCALLWLYSARSRLSQANAIWSCPSNVSGHAQPAVDQLSDAGLGSVGFPKKIWQSWKGPRWTLGPRTQSLVRSWIESNPDHRYELLTDRSAETYMRDRYAHRPDISDTFLAIQDPILRADLLRYTVMLSDGGVYTDIDTNPLKPIHQWLSSDLAERASLVIGIEIDQPEGPTWSSWHYPYGFCQWTLMAKPGHMLMERIVTNVVTNLNKYAGDHNQTLGSIQLDFEEVLALTGPAAFTDTVLALLTELTDSNVTWSNITRPQGPQLFGDVLVLPIDAFASGQKHSNSGPSHGEDVLAQHLFRSSWSKSHSLHAVQDGDDKNYDGPDEKGDDGPDDKGDDDQGAAHAEVREAEPV